MEITEEYYLENRKKKRYSEEIMTFTAGMSYTISQLKERLEEIEKKFSDKENVDLWIDPARYETEDYDSILMVSWVDWETEKEFEMRMWENKWAKEHAVDSLKRLIKSNKEDAVRIIKDLGLI